MSCARFEPLIALFVESDLTAGEGRRVELHLEACRGCREFAADLRESQAALKSLRSDFVKEAVFEEVRAGVLRNLSTPQRAGVWPRYVIAAMLLMGLGAGWLWLTQPAATLDVQPRAAVIASPPLVAMVPPLRVRPARVWRRRTRPAFKSEPLVVKMITDDPQLVIYWLVDQNGG
jgi:anti-sigma factor RsiW